MTKEKLYRFIVGGLITVLCIKILGFFTWSENINITRVLKIVMRLSSTGGLALLYLMLINRGYIPRFQYRNTLAVWFYFAYLFLGLLSLWWTSNPFYSTLQLFMTGESILFVYWFFCIIEMLKHHFSEYEVRLGKIFSASIFPILLLFIVGMYINPDQFFRLTHGGEVARLGGFMMNPNELGMLAVVGISCAMLEWKSRNKIWSTIIIGTLIYGLLLTSSRSSLGSLAIVMAYFTLKSDNWYLKAGAVIVAVLAAPVLFQKIILKQGDLQEVLSMTGRLPFWKALISEGLIKAPWFGFGFMRIAEGDYFISVHSYAARMTHNTFVQVLMNLGFVGFGIVMMQMAFTIYNWLKAKSKYLKQFFIVVFIPITINSFTEFGIFGENNFGILFYQFLIGLFVIQYLPKFTNKEKAFAEARQAYYAIEEKPADKEIKIFTFK